MEGRFVINGVEKVLSFEPDATLLQVLRDGGFTEVKRGCDTGECGACAVVLNGDLVTSCKVYAASVVGSEILTAKGLGTVQNPHPIQQAFVDAGAIQCGFCTPGMVMATYALLSKNPYPTDDEIKRALDGNKCRCTGYVKIFDAVRLAAERMRDHG
ncbi:(2Fe-2S)-binding domain protein [Dethiosulfovibrio peptidovorans DSM 11002]|uniref:(2Fe-2S)-binding domain protein n=1 Tax=Dethiosulfovibrio peptidovorans DSM 11002 TaxID=469381 RepID=D2Z8P9_9BACT|nr:(2Fe-2S)-binding protein [Dethiosulfovibrio peptidovorans]EFC91846.1 (2Fe-2S)-binding domain protein [Dethiosulfovibrio peptidovorans DSM 11002]